MNYMNCPHCQSEDIVPESVLNGVVAVMPCPKCAHLLVRFRNKIIVLNRDTLINGSKEERTFHLAEVIAEFLDDTDFNFDLVAPRILDKAPGFSQPKDDVNQEDNEIVEISQDEFLEDLEPISDDEIQRFVDFELNAIDNMDYFKKHLE